MTNKDKFLKDGVSVEEFVNEFQNFCAKQNNNNASSIRLEQFLSRKVQPTLTKDERAILRNIKKDYKYIGKIKFLGVTVLYVSQKEKSKDFTPLTAFEHLFQFIKERRRIFNRRIVRR